MKKCFSLLKVFLCFVLICSLFFSSVCAEEILFHDNDCCDGNNEFQVVKLDEFKTAFIDKNDNEIRYTSDEGNFYYVYEGTEHLIEILDVSPDGVLHWRILTEELDLSGYVNTSGAPEPQMSVAIGGGAVFVSGALAYAASFAAKVVIAGTACYVGSVAYQAIRKKSNAASYYPAYKMFGTVYVATIKGLSKSTAVKYISRGKDVWAKSKSLAKSACKSASPVGTAEWSMHGDISDGYYPHYHAVKKYNKKGTYTHTGAHCWYYG